MAVIIAATIFSAIKSIVYLYRCCCACIYNEQAQLLLRIFRNNESTSHTNERRLLPHFNIL